MEGNTHEESRIVCVDCLSVPDRLCLRDSDGNDVEGGCSVDLPIPVESNVVMDCFAGLLNIYGGVPSYKGYFDSEMLDTMMNDWFANQSETRNAA